MGNMYDGLLVEVRVDFSCREIVTGSEIRIYKETQLYGQLIEGCIFFMKLRCGLVVVVVAAMSLGEKKLPTETLETVRQGG
jgi:uncharacterized protein YpmS